MKCRKCARERPADAISCPSCLTPQVSLTTALPIAEQSFTVNRDLPRDWRFLPGTVLAGRYRVIALLGRGGMGEVYRADDLELDQAVALKFLPSELAGDARRRQLLRREVRTARRIVHPNVCRVYDIGEVDGDPFLLMEHIDGEDLATLLRRIGRLALPKALQIARQLASGLAAVHEQGIAHRDLKPANLMIDGRGQVRITDFGLASLADPSRRQLTGGTPSYMAPEQRRGERASERSDLYALGLVLYELSTGQRPDLSARQETPAPIRPMVDLEPALERAISHCLEPDPEQRPASARALVAMLAGEDRSPAQISAARDAPTATLSAAPHRWPAAPALVLALATGLAIITLVGDDLLRGGGQMARGVAEALDRVVALPGDSPAPPASSQPRTDSPASARSAYDLYLEGRYLWNQRTETGLRQALDLFSRAIEIDPEFALAYSGLADAWILLPIYSDPPVSDDQARSHARRAARRALELDDSLAEAHNSMAEVLIRYDDWPRAEAEFRRAIELQPSYPTAHHWYGAHLMSHEGRSREGIRELEYARLLDPASQAILSMLARAYHSVGRYEDAIACFREVERLGQWAYLPTAQARTLLAVRQFSEAAEMLEAAHRDPGFSLDGWALWTEARHLASDHGAEIGPARLARQRYPQRHLALRLEARGLAALGRIEEVRRRYSEILSLPVGPGTGSSLCWIADELRFHGYPEAGREIYRLSADRLLAYSAEERQEDPGWLLDATHALAGAGRMEEAAELRQRILALPRQRWPALGLDERLRLETAGLLAAQRGERDAARRSAKLLATLGDSLPPGRHWVSKARIETQLGNYGAAVKAMERALASGLVFDLEIHSDLFLEHLEHDTRYRELLRRYNLPVSAPRSTLLSTPQSTVTVQASATRS